MFTVEIISVTGPSEHDAERNTLAVPTKAELDKLGARALDTVTSHEAESIEITVTGDGGEVRTVRVAWENTLIGRAVTIRDI